MYRNYDGAGSTFGTVSVGASTSLSGVAVYAARDDVSSIVRVVVINKTQSALTPTMDLLDFSAAATAKRWIWTAAAGGTLAPATDVTVASGKVALDVPAQSMTLLVFSKQ